MILISTIYDIPLEDATIDKIEIFGDNVAVYVKLYNIKNVKIVFINYYEIIDSHSIDKEIGDFEMNHSSDLIQQIVSEEIKSGASREYMDLLELIHFSLFEPWERKKILEIVCEKIEIEYL